MMPHAKDTRFKKGNIPLNLKDHTGETFGYLKVIKNAESKKGKAAWLCECVCGKQLVVAGDSLRLGQKSCGCVRRRKRTHGLSNSREYKIWSGIKSRCNSIKYQAYGGRGINICDRWNESFEHFYADMGDCPSGFSIERIDVNGNYEPGNCVWIDSKLQARNKRNNIKVDNKLAVDISNEHGIKYSTVVWRIKNGIDINKEVTRKKYLTFNGITLCYKDWALRLGIAHSTITERLKKGWALDKVLKEESHDVY